MIISPIKSDFLGQGTTLVELLHQRAKHHPHRKAYIFLEEGEIQTSCLTYQELEHQVQAIAAHLQSVSAPGDRALLIYPSGLDFVVSFFACLYAGIIAVPTYPPKRNQKLSRLQNIVRDAQASLLLTTADIFPLIAQKEYAFTQLQWVLTDRITTKADDFTPIAIEPNTTAFLQYTSGSTGTPKGVIVSHGNLAHNCHVIQHSYQESAEGIVLNWLPLYHDMGLVGGTLQPIVVGFPVILMSPIAFLQDPIRWLRIISTYKVTVTVSPNFAYDLCIQKFKPEELTNLDLSSWQIAINGAEPVRAETIASFINTFAPYGFRPSTFRPSYGMAETTLLVTGATKSKSPVIKVCDAKALEENQVISCTKETQISRKIVSCGHPCLGQTVAIVNPVSLARCEPGQIGEIWVTGESVAQGYWHQEELTKEIFHAYLADTKEGPFLRTGDLGFWEDEAGLFVTGRIKDILIIRGRNHYPQDIEQTVETSHPALNFHGIAAFCVEIDGDNRLIVACEVKRTYVRHLQVHSKQAEDIPPFSLPPAPLPLVEEVAKAIRKAVLREHDLQVYQVLLLKPGTLLKTSSGKMQRLACREAFLAGNLPLVASELLDISLSEAHPKNYSVESIQSWIRQWLAAKLHISIQSVDGNESFESYGLDSLTAATFIQDLETWSGYLLNISTLQSLGAIANLAEYLAQELAHHQDRPPDQIPPEYYQIECFPEYAQLQQRLTQIQTLEIPNPYFQVQESLTRDCTQIQARTLINYSTYNYLGLSGEPIVSAAAKAAIDCYGTSVCASRLASGERLLHQELEQELAEFIGVEDCIVYVSGHATNVTTIGHLFNSQDLILYDALSHNSILQGCALSGAKTVPFPHNDWQALDKILQDQRQHYRRVLIVIEGVYSMDGDIPDLPRFIELKQRHKTLLMVDEAHSIGVLGQHGRGIGEYFDVDRNHVDLWMGTLSKAFASCGEYIAGSKALINYLKYTAPGFVYSVGSSPANTAAALASLRLLKSEPERVKTLQKRSQQFLQLAQAQGWNTATSQNSPIIPIVVGNSLTCIQLSHHLFQAGINVQPMIYPAVANDAARLRFFISCLHTEAQINQASAALANAKFICEKGFF
jgi:8-amino-7-oxononanoate synthase